MLDINHCQVRGDPEISGPGNRISVVYLIALILPLTAARIIPPYQRDDGVKNEFRAKLARAISNLNALNTISAVILLVVAVSKRSYLSWFSLHFVVNIAYLAGCSTTLAAMAIPDFFKDNLFQIVMALVYFPLQIIELIEFKRKMATVMEQEPQCLPHILSKHGSTRMFVAVLADYSCYLFVAMLHRAEFNPNQRWLK
ncbi:hypothetical protein K469DRAFT_686627 [Zopfia rhizophila CBS 207.26]|uniref:Uncharacterized protein n=1 Tax=Zopfia rhizophila CBS 207.26 TaxID=1314779 RepID=A0A6A6EST7_9PEZI|nr:hypothetical protein K469DRAFT_686627 [Zopfia rhizophila CBS 207.26]